MSRGCTIARLTVDRPSHPIVTGYTASWLKDRAHELESHGDERFNDTGPFIARRFSPALAFKGPSRAAATLRIEVPGSLSIETRLRIANWLRSRADHLTNGRGVFEGRWFTQEFKL